MCLSCEEECDRIFRVVDNLVEALEVGEEEVCALVCRKAAAEADGEAVRVDFLQE